MLGGCGHGFFATDTCPWHIYVCVRVSHNNGAPVGPLSVRNIFGNTLGPRQGRACVKTISNNRARGSLKSSPIIFRYLYLFIFIYISLYIARVGAGRNRAT